MSEAGLATGATLRVTGPRDGLVVLCLNGGTGHERAGVWGASVEYVVRKLAPTLPHVGFAELRYRVRSWKQMDMCIDDGTSAVEALVAAGAREVVLLGYSMGGAVSCALPEHRLVRRVIGLAPWLPERLPMPAMRGRRLDVFHGSLDGSLPGIPGVSARSSREGFERLRRAGTTGTYTLIPGGIHPIALRVPWGSLMPMPRASRWLSHVATQLSSPAM